MKPEILEICEVWPDTDKTIRFQLTKLGKSKFEVSAEFPHQKTPFGEPKIFKNEQEAWNYFNRMVQNMSEATGEVAPPIWLRASEVEALGEPNFKKVLESNPMDEDPLLYAMGEDNKGPYIATLRRGVHEADIEYFDSIEAAEKELMEIYEIYCKASKLLKDDDEK